MNPFEKLKRRQSTLDAEIARQTGSAPAGPKPDFKSVKASMRSTELPELYTEGLRRRGKIK